MAEEKDLRFRVQPDPKGGPFTDGFAVHDMSDGSCLAYIADEDNALCFLELMGRRMDPANWRAGLYQRSQYMKADIVIRVADALYEVFHENLPKNPNLAKIRLKRYIFTGEEDPGQWSPRALAVVHIDALMLPGNEEIQWIEQWSQASEKLDGAYFEHINGGVVAVYPC